MKLILVSIAFFEIFQTTNAQQCTGPNEVRRSGTACQTTCSNLYEDRLCTLQAILGCFCQDGFVRNSQGICVRVESCYNDRCGENEERSCGPACDATCATYGLPCPIINVQCNNMCYCKNGYARNDCGKCIPVEQCPRSIGCGGDPNASNVTCPSSCPATCSNYNDGPRPCPRLCRVNGCECNRGLVLSETTPVNYCVRPQDCSRCPGPNEHWSTDLDCSCQDLASCSSRVGLTQISRAPGCRCIDGYVRDSNNVCIAAGTCPHCGPNEQYSTCGTACPRTCANRFNSPGACITLCVEGCFCQSGYIRNGNGRCVTPDHC